MFTLMTSLYKRRYDVRNLGAGNLLTEVGQGVKTVSGILGGSKNYSIFDTTFGWNFQDHCSEKP
jgi:hypothetical protein